MEIIWFFILISFVLVYVAIVGAMIARLVSRGGQRFFGRNSEQPAIEQEMPLRG
ncbi:MAG TPA: hypothetical protein VIG62_10930 [Blastocatellia bacterium]|jgi:hypothetical protein